MKIKKFKENAFIPKKSHDLDCGMDLYLPETVTFHPLETLCIPMGLGFEIPEGFAGVLVPRSSIAKKGIVIHPAIIDPGYTGEIHLIATNCSKTMYTFETGERLCSIVCYSLLNPTIQEVKEFSQSERGSSGLGSSGK